MNFKKLILVAVIVGAVVALPFINRSVFGTDAKAVNVSAMSQRVISHSILASGFLAHEEEVLLSSEIIGGQGGGGRKDFAQAGGQDQTKINEAFEKIKTLI